MVESRENTLIFAHKIGSDFVTFDVLRKIRIEHKPLSLLKLDWSAKALLSATRDEFNARARHEEEKTKTRMLGIYNAYVCYICVCSHII